MIPDYFYAPEAAALASEIFVVEVVTNAEASVNVSEEGAYLEGSGDSSWDETTVHDAEGATSAVGIYVVGAPDC